jgi:cysteinyl-tRNA synthetase
MLEFGGEKMAKSVGNIVSLREALDRWGREAILVLFLGAHYRSPVDFSEDAIEQAKAQWEDFSTAFRVAAVRGDAPGWDEFAAALDDDFNTPAALAILHEWRAAGRLDELARGLRVFGLEAGTDAGEAPAEVILLAEEREAARAARDFEAADRLRAEIDAAGWEVQDVADGFRLIPKA